MVFIAIVKNRKCKETISKLNNQRGELSNIPFAANVTGVVYEQMYLGQHSPSIPVSNLLVPKNYRLSQSPSSFMVFTTFPLSVLFPSPCLEESKSRFHNCANNTFFKKSWFSLNLQEDLRLTNTFQQEQEWANILTCQTALLKTANIVGLEGLKCQHIFRITNSL